MFTVNKQGFHNNNTIEPTTKMWSSWWEMPLPIQAWERSQSCITYVPETEKETDLVKNKEKLNSFEKKDSSRDGIENEMEGLQSNDGNEKWRYVQQEIGLKAQSKWSEVDGPRERKTYNSKNEIGSPKARQEYVEGKDLKEICVVPHILVIRIVGCEFLHVAFSLHSHDVVKVLDCEQTYY